MLDVKTRRIFYGPDGRMAISQGDANRGMAKQNFDVGKCFLFLFFRFVSLLPFLDILRYFYSLSVFEI